MTNPLKLRKMLCNLDLQKCPKASGIPSRQSTVPGSPRFTHPTPVTTPRAAVQYQCTSISAEVPIWFKVCALSLHIRQHLSLRSYWSIFSLAGRGVPSLVGFWNDFIWGLETDEAIRTAHSTSCCSSNCLYVVRAAILFLLTCPRGGLSLRY
ncbi:hypothetical protein BR93DRAFT_182811 [Coniochaeta sp. PMI_546]|nr:hypothetical protein BR93DRAFT_182811 [Coniochaeta sp. PMI_546]